MHIKFLARGTGSAVAAAVYLLGDQDAAGKVRVAVEVLRGDPFLVAAVADSLPFKHRYTSGALAWSPDDAPTPAQIEQVLDEFEKSAWAGLTRDRYAWAAVLHRDDDGGAHVHVVAARCDLESGRSLNIAPPGWERTFDPLRDAFNYTHGWSRPDDPARSRAYRPSPPRGDQAATLPQGMRDASTLLAGLLVEPDPRAVIGEYVERRVQEGTVSDRAGVAAALEEAGLEVTRQGRHYVTARHPETGDRWRLRGDLYEEDLDREQFMRRHDPERRDDREPADGGEDAVRAAAEAWKAVQETRLRRAQYHWERYGGGDVGRERVPADPLLHLRRELGDDAMVASESSAERSAGGAAARHGGDADRPDPRNDPGDEPFVREREPAIGGADLGGADVLEGRGAVAAVERVRPKTEIEWLLMSQEVGRREEHVRSSAGDDRLIDEASAELNENGVCVFGDGGLTERAQLIGVAESLLEKEHAELDRKERALLAHPAGVEHLLHARFEVVGAADGEAKSLAERTRIVTTAASMQKAAEAKHEAEAQQARIEALDRLPGGMDLYHAHLADLDPAWSVNGKTTPPREHIKAALLAAESDEKRQTRLRDVLSDEATAARYREVLDEKSGRFTTTDLDRALAAAERDRAERDTRRWEDQRDARVETLERLPGGLDLFHGHLADLDPAWDLQRNNRSSREHIDAALLAAESDESCQERLRGVLSDGAAAARYREVLDESSGRFTTTDLDRALAAAERGRAERETRRWEEQRDAGVQALERLLGGLNLYYAYLADRDPKWDRKRNDTSSREHIDAALAAARSDTFRLGRLRDVLSNEVDAACYRETLEAAGERFTLKRVDAAIEAVRRRREEEAWQRKEDEARRRAAVEGLETTLRATKQGVARLDEAARQVLSSGGRDLTLEEREHVAQTVAGRIRADLEQRKEQVASTAAGARFLAEALRSAGADTLAEEERLVDAAQDRLGEYQQTRYEALSPAGRELYGAWVMDVAPAGHRPGGPAEAVAARVYDATVADERLPRLEAVYQDDKQRSYYRGVLAAAADSPTLGQIDSALQATEVFEDRKNTVIEYPGSHKHPSGKELWAAARLSLAGQTDAAASPAVLDAALSRVESQLEQRVQEAADEVEKMVWPQRPDPHDPHDQPDHRVPAPSDEQLDEVVKPDDDVFYKATVAEVRKREQRRALQEKRYDKARQEAYLEDKVATERSSSDRLSWGDALAIVLKTYLARIREFFQVACDTVLGGDLGERLAGHRAQVQQAADKAEEKLEKMPYETGPAVPVVSDRSLAVVAGAASLPFVQDVVVETGERYKRREVEGHYSHSARMVAERGYLHDAFEKRWRSPSSAALSRSEVEAEVFAEYRRTVREVFEVACDEVFGRGELGARLEKHRAQVQRTADTVGQVMERGHLPTLSDETLVDVRAAASDSSFLQEVVDVVRERYDRGTPIEELDDAARRRREGEEDYLARLIEQEFEGQREARRASTRQAARERVIESYHSWILSIFVTARDEVLGSGDGGGGAAGGGGTAGPPLERPSPPGQELQPPGGAQPPAAAPPSRGLGASERRTTGGGRAGRGENGPSGR